MRCNVSMLTACYPRVAQRKLDIFQQWIVLFIGCLACVAPSQLRSMPRAAFITQFRFASVFIYDCLFFLEQTQSLQSDFTIFTSLSRKKFKLKSCCSFASSVSKTLQISFSSPASHWSQLFIYRIAIRVCRYSNILYVHTSMVIQIYLDIKDATIVVAPLGTLMTYAPGRMQVTQRRLLRQFF